MNNIECEDHVIKNEHNLHHCDNLPNKADFPQESVRNVSRGKSNWGIQLCRNKNKSCGGRKYGSVSISESTNHSAEFALPGCTCSDHVSTVAVTRNVKQIRDSNFVPYLHSHEVHLTTTTPNNRHYRLCKSRYELHGLEHCVWETMVGNRSD